MSYIPLPNPIKDETEEEFVNRFLDDPIAKEEFPNLERRSAVAYSRYRSNGKKSLYCNIVGLETKESKDGELIKGGYISTTYIDSGFFDEERNMYIRDKVHKDTLDAWANEINNSNPRSNKASIYHERIPHVAGTAIKDSARVDFLGIDDKGESHYGLYVDTLFDKTRPDFKDIKYRIDNDLIDSYSIEFSTKNPATGEYLENAVREEQFEGGILRHLLPGTILEGYTVCSQPMNEGAVMIKEIQKRFIESKQNNPYMTSEVQAHRHTWKPDSKTTSTDMGHNHPIDIESMNVLEGNTNHTHKLLIIDNEKVIKTKSKKIDMEDTKMIEKETKQSSPDYLKPKKETPDKRMEMEDEEMKQSEENKESKEMEEDNENMKKETEKQRYDSFLELKEIRKDYTDFKKFLSEQKLESKGRMNPENKNDSKEFIEYKTKVFNDKYSIESKFKIAGELADSLDLHYKNTKRVEARNYKNFTTNGSRLEYKGLGIDTNSTSYTQSSAELNDVYDPVIYNTLNERTTTWGILSKDDMTNKGNNLIQFTVKSGANTTAAAYKGNAISLGNTEREKNETRFKKYAVGVAIDGDMIAAARGGPIGDVFSQEVRDSTETLMSLINIDIFGEQGLETDAKIIGLPYITDAAGNPTLYGFTRANFSYMDGNSGATYINNGGSNITRARLRQAIRNAYELGNANIQDLVFICNMTQHNKFLDIYDQLQRTVPTSSRFGFEGRSDFDGVPIFVDKDCKDGSWFLVDMRLGYRVGIWIPPSLEMLGKDSDSDKAFVKTYFGTYSRHPNNNIEIYNNSTTV